MNASSEIDQLIQDAKTIGIVDKVWADWLKKRVTRIVALAAGAAAVDAKRSATEDEHQEPYRCPQPVRMHD